MPQNLLDFARGHVGLGAESQALKLCHDLAVAVGTTATESVFPEYSAQTSARSIYNKGERVAQSELLTSEHVVMHAAAGPP